MRKSIKNPNFAINQSLEIDWKILTVRLRKIRKKQIKIRRNLHAIKIVIISQLPQIPHPHIFGFRLVRTNSKKLPNLQINLKNSRYVYL